MTPARAEALMILIAILAAIFLAFLAVQTIGFPR